MERGASELRSKWDRDVCRKEERNTVRIEWKKEREREKKREGGGKDEGAEKRKCKLQVSSKQAYALWGKGGKVVSTLTFEKGKNNGWESSIRLFALSHWSLSHILFEVLKFVLTCSFIILQWKPLNVITG